LDVENPRFSVLPFAPAVWQNSHGMKSFITELKRRNVHKVALTCAVIAWLLIQFALIPALELPSWAIKTLVVVLIIGFITIVFISWFFEATPEGMKRTADISPTEVLPTWSRKKFTVFIVVSSLLAAGLLIFELFQR
jgi:small-conductance mechanosensitive channel